MGFQVNPTGTWCGRMDLARVVAGGDCLPRCPFCQVPWQGLVRLKPFTESHLDHPWGSMEEWVGLLDADPAVDPTLVGGPASQGVNDLNKNYVFRSHTDTTYIHQHLENFKIQIETILVIVNCNINSICLSSLIY